MMNQKEINAVRVGVIRLNHIHT